MRAGEAQAWIFGLSGAVAVSLVGLAVWLLGFGRARANALAAEMTQDLRRLAKVVEHTSNAVVITDVHRRITWVNRGFTEVTGYGLDEVMGSSPGQLLQCPETDPAVVAAIRSALQHEEPFKGELLNRAKGGRLYWLTMEIQPLRDEDGVLQGFMAIETDITAVKEAQERQSRAEGVLRGAIDAVGEAFVLFDPEDRLVFANDQYRTLYSKSRHLIAPGVSFESIIRNGVEQGQFPQSLGREEAWIQERLQQHRAGNREGTANCHHATSRHPHPLRSAMLFLPSCSCGAILCVSGNEGAASWRRVCLSIAAAVTHHGQISTGVVSSWSGRAWK